jgi:site-specific DNA-methyltransferase (adenine-specific)
MRTMPTQSVAIVVTSPPYNLGKGYSLHKDSMPEADYLAWQGEVAKEISRILRPDGHLFLNVGSDSAHPRRAEDVAIVYERYLIRQQTIVWVKSLAVDASAIPEPELRQVLHERTLGHFVSLNSDCFLNPCWEPVFHFTPSGRSPINRLAIGVPYVFKDQPERFGHSRDKHCRGNVWHNPYPTKQSRADLDYHPATFPVALAERCLRLAVPPVSGLVLDPFLGIGSTLLAAKTLNLDGVGIEIDPAYCAAARRRLSQGNEG